MCVCVCIQVCICTHMRSFIHAHTREYMIHDHASYSHRKGAGLPTITEDCA